MQYLVHSGPKHIVISDRVKLYVYRSHRLPNHSALAMQHTHVGLPGKRTREQHFRSPNTCCIGTLSRALAYSRYRAQEWITYKELTKVKISYKPQNYLISQFSQHQQLYCHTHLAQLHCSWPEPEGQGEEHSETPFRLLLWGQNEQRGLWFHRVSGTC